MTKDDLKALVEDTIMMKREGQTLEVKSAHKGCPRLYETLSSFANQNAGGTILLGIDEGQGFAGVGVYDVQDLIHMAEEQCRAMEPKILPFFTDVRIDGKDYVSMEIPALEPSRRPCYYKGSGLYRGSYARNGESDEVMGDYEIYSYDSFRKQLKEDARQTEADMDILDQALLQKFFLRLREGRTNISNVKDEALLSLYSIKKNDHPTLAALLCFSHFAQAYFPQLCLTAVRVPGTRMGDVSEDERRFIANKKIEGTIEEMLQGALAFVASNMRMGLKVVDGVRIDVPEYPLSAVREAVLNALAHRDYGSYTEGMPVRLEMYSDRLEIVSPGGLYGFHDVDELGRIECGTRNSALVTILETLGVMENRYSGIPTIRKLLREAHLPDPVFIDRKGMFKVIFYNGSKAGEERPESLEDYCKTPRTREEIASFLGKGQYYAMKKFVEPLIEQGKLAYSLQEKPQSRNQRIYTVNK